MKITIHDNWLLKFSGVLLEHWKSKGHEVAYEPGYNAERVKDSDVVFFESSDTNVALACREKPPKKGRVYVRVVDIDAYDGRPGAIDPEYVDGVIFIAPHIYEMCLEKHENIRRMKEEGRTELIRMGVDLSKFPFRKKEQDTKRICFISQRLTPEKGFDIALQIFDRLHREDPEYTFHVIGEMYQNEVWTRHIDHILSPPGMKSRVHITPRFEGHISEFLQDKDTLLLYSRKEAFSFVTAEAIAMGLQPVVYNFWGANSIWPEEILADDPIEAYEIIKRHHQYDPERTLTWVKDLYDPMNHLRYMDEFMKIP